MPTPKTYVNSFGQTRTQTYYKHMGHGAYLTLEKDGIWVLRDELTGYPRNFRGQCFSKIEQGNCYSSYKVFEKEWKGYCRYLNSLDLKINPWR